MKLLNARTAGFTLVVLLGGVILFQILMLVGYPLQRAMGGGPWDAPAPAMVIASFVASLILLFAMGVVLEKLGIVRLIQRRRVVNGLLWLMAAYFLLSAVGTLFTLGDIRFVLAPLALVVSVLCLMVARAPFADGK